MSEGIKLLTSVLGALALFIYGMGLMSDGLKETAGAKLKGALNYMTRNRLLAIVAGAAVTALIQSSSATSVMTVGFVNAGLLSLRQAIGVIFGANVGTTITLLHHHRTDHLAEIRRPSTAGDCCGSGGTDDRAASGSAWSLANPARIRTAFPWNEYDVARTEDSGWKG